MVDLEDFLMQGRFVVQVKYTIVYVNTEGIQHVRVHFILRDITEKDLPLRQSFEVTYAQPSRIVSWYYDLYTS